MKIDYTLKDILENDDIKNYLKYGEVKIRKCINKIEEEYFDGKKIYHAISTSDKANFLFRFEISGLLLLLLKLEMDDPFDKRSKRKGISDLSVNKMLNPLKNEDIDILSNYEYRIIVQYCDPEHVSTIIDLLNQTKKSLTHLAVLYAAKYDDFICGLSSSILEKIDQLTKMIIFRSYHEGDLRISTFLDLNDDLTRIIPKPYLKQISLKEAVIKAINRIIRDIYYFDENKTCYRKVFLPKDEEHFKEIADKFHTLQMKHLDIEFKDRKTDVELLYRQSKNDDIYYMEDKNDNIYDRYKNDDREYDLNTSQLSRVDKLYKSQTEMELDEKEISLIKKGIEEVLNDYYLESFDITPEKHHELNNDEIKIIEDRFISYAKCLYDFQLNSIKDIKEHSWRKIIEYRRYIENKTICDIGFESYLFEFEKKFFDRYSSNKENDEKYLNELIKTTLNNFKEDIKAAQCEVEKELTMIDSCNYKDTPYENIEENIKKIRTLIDELVNEVYAMIIRLRKKE